MPISLFHDDCKESIRNDNLFGICDDQDGKAAYTNIINPDNWVAKVINKQQINIQFMAIDNCIKIIKKDGNMENRCDGLLMFSENIIFVELKDKRKDWINEAICQLEATINHYRQYENIDDLYKHKQAFACNKKHPQFHYSHKQIMQNFFSTNKVRLKLEATIKI